MRPAPTAHTVSVGYAHDGRRPAPVMAVTENSNRGDPPQRTTIGKSPGLRSGRALRIGTRHWHAACRHGNAEAGPSSPGSRRRSRRSGVEKNWHSARRGRFLAVSPGRRSAMRRPSMFASRAAAAAGASVLQASGAVEVAGAGAACAATREKLQVSGGKFYTLCRGRDPGGGRRWRRDRARAHDFPASGTTCLLAPSMPSRDDPVRADRRTSPGKGGERIPDPSRDPAQFTLKFTLK